MTAEGTRYHLDTNSCIYLFSGEHPQLSARVRTYGAGQLKISAVVLAEIRYGMRRGKGPTPAVLESFLRMVEVLDLGAEVADSYARLPLKRGTLDHLIAAHALSEGATLVSTNTRDFFRSKELLLEDWTT